MKSRWTISALCAFFVAIALVVSGCGSSSSSVPSGSVASVAGNTISKQALDHWLYIDEKSQSASEPGEPVIVPNDPPKFANCVAQVKKDFAQYKKTPAATIQGLCGKLFAQLNSTVLGFLVESYQYQAYAHQHGITVTDADVDQQVAKLKKQQFKTNAAYEQYLKESGYTNADVLYRTRVVAIYQKLAKAHTPKVDAAAISAYYSAHKSTFGSPETRNMRIVLAKSQAQASAALSALKSGQSWDAVAKKYSQDPTTKDKGGLLTDVSEGQQDAALSKAAFAAPLNKLEGPIKGQFGWYVVDVIKITPATTESLAKATPEIKSTLTQAGQTTAEKSVNAEVAKAFKAKTLCAEHYGIPLCANAKSTTLTPTTATTPATTTPPASSTTTSSSSAASGASSSSSTTTSSSSSQ